jgi:hypothetical protein
MTRFLAISLLIFFALSSGGAAETPSKPVVLFRGDFTGWEYFSPSTNRIDEICRVDANDVISIAGKPNGYIATTHAYENYVLHAEWRWTEKPGNGGVLVHITEGPMDRIWPISFQIQTKNTRVGDLLPMSSAKFSEPVTPELKPAQLARVTADSEKSVGEWNTCKIVCREDTIEVTINGTLQNRVTKCIPASGKIGFQLEGTAFELRNVRLESLQPARATK